MKELMISKDGFTKTIEGEKTATSRLGDRTNEFAVGDVVSYKENVLPFRETKVKVTGLYTIPLQFMTFLEAVQTGHADEIEAIIEFTSLYTKLGREVYPESVITLINFEEVK